MQKSCCTLQCTIHSVDKHCYVVQIAPSCIHNARAVAPLAPLYIHDAGAVAQLAPSCIHNVGAVGAFICSQNCPFVLPLNCAHATFNMVRIREMCDSVCKRFSLFVFVCGYPSSSSGWRYRMSDNSGLCRQPN